ncbi:hypothetical protein BDN71DRAFT_1428106 [Pleurotus eryngii]|uniref:Uncharacterized protein n=1 Tax=Pleurotus eryngii TaxID=5323 RepID=A0A9P6A5I7_PLEER|nr:hypothetical protein BDN71DRAFT_1428106 [Pleurotus eryngii]
MPDLPKMFQDAVAITRRLGIATGTVISGSIRYVSYKTKGPTGAHALPSQEKSTPPPCAPLPRSQHAMPMTAASSKMRGIRFSSATAGFFPAGADPWAKDVVQWVQRLAWERVECSATEEVPVGEVKEFSSKASFFALNTHRDDPERRHKYLATTPVPLHVLVVDSILRSVGGDVRRDKALGDVHWMVRSLGLMEGNLLDGPTVTEEYLAPTWSWAGVEGRVFLALTHGVEPGSWRWKAEVMHIGYVGEDERRGCARLLAMIKKVRCMNGSSLNPGIETLAPSFEEVGWEPDVWPTPTQAPSEVFCILIARVIGNVEQREPDSEIGLVVQETAGGLGRLRLWRQRLDEREGLFSEVITGAVEVVLTYSEASSLILVAYYSHFTTRIILLSPMDAFTVTKFEDITVTAPPVNEEGGGSGGGAYCVVA